MNVRMVFCVLMLVEISCAHRQEAPLVLEHRAASVAPVVVNRVSEKSVVLGQSLEGRAITMTLLGDGADGVLILGAIHGNEATSATVAARLVEYLQLHQEILVGRRVGIVAVANPDGVARGLRTNVHLIDLNRNFPAGNWKKTRKGMNFGGDEAASEPETLALLKAFEMMKPARVVSIHSMDKPCNNFDGPGKGLAEAMGKCNGYEVKDNIGYPTPGSLGSWAGIDRGIAIITLELRHSMAGDKAWEENRAALVGVIEGRE